MLWSICTRGTLNQRLDQPVVGLSVTVPTVWRVSSTCIGGLWAPRRVRRVGRDGTEGTILRRRFQHLEDAGAFAVECQLIPSDVLAEINRRTTLATISLGSRPHGDMMFLFQSDVVGESARVPRNAHVFGDVSSLQQPIRDERVRALAAFRTEGIRGAFPSDTEIGTVDPDEFARFTQVLDTT